MNAFPLQNLSREQQRAIAARANKSSTWNKYYSTVRFQADRSGAMSPYTFTMASQELRAFSYALGADMSAGTIGFPSGTTATPADTNLLTGAQTVSGEKVLVYGMSALITADSDAFLAKLCAPDISVIVELDGGLISWKLGSLEMVPGSGGLSGFGDSYLQTPSLLDTYVRHSGAINNGVPHIGNFYPFPQALVWTPAGATDSNLVVKLRLERAKTVTVTERAASAAAMGSTGAAAFSAPAATDGALGSFFSVKVHLHSRQISDRSQNQ
jgi:hypothetical protein